MWDAVIWLFAFIGAALTVLFAICLVGAYAQIKWEDWKRENGDPNE